MFTVSGAPMLLSLALNWYDTWTTALLIGLAAVREMNQSNELARRAMERGEQAADSLGAVIEAVTRMNDLNARIATVTGEQSAAVQEINQNISHINDVVTATSEGAQGTLRTSEELQHAAADLHSAVARFRS